MNAPVVLLALTASCLPPRSPRWPSVELLHLPQLSTVCESSSSRICCGGPYGSSVSQR